MWLVCVCVCVCVCSFCARDRWVLMCVYVCVSALEIDDVLQLRQRQNEMTAAELEPSTSSHDISYANPTRTFRVESYMNGCVCVDRTDDDSSVI